MSESGFEIIDYEGGRDAEVAALILSVQRDDVGIFVPVEEQPELLDIAGAYRDGGFWVAVASGEIVGTIGMMRYGPSGVLKKLFVRRDYRGRTGRLTACTTGPSPGPRRAASPRSSWTHPRVATRSHAFYRRRGFCVVDRAELPEGL
ncbi:GNAT family N-acetyltransferase [Caulobacter segnis]